MKDLAVIKRLEKHLNNWIEENPDVNEREMQWYTDEKTEEKYTWKVKIEGVIYTWSFIYDTKKIQQTVI